MVCHKYFSEKAFLYGLMKDGRFLLLLGANIEVENMHLGNRRIILKTCEVSWCNCPLSLLLYTLTVIKNKYLTVSSA